MDPFQLQLNLKRWKNVIQSREYRNDTNINWDDIESHFNAFSKGLGNHFENMDERINNLVLNASNQENLATDALVDADNNKFASLKARLDSIDEDIQERGLNVKKFGAVGNGAEDDSDAIQSAINFATEIAKIYHTRIMIYFPNGSYKVTKTLVIDASYVSLFSHGSRIYYTKSDGTLFFITTKQDRAYKQNFRILDGFYLEASTRGTTTALHFAGDRNPEGGSGKGPSHVKLYSVNISNFDRGLEFGDNAYLIAFNDCDIYDCNYCMYVHDGTTNSGERISFRDCSFYDSKTVAYVDGWFDIHFNCCSFDYCEKFVNQKKGNIFIDHSSLETKEISTAMFIVDKSENETPGFEAVYPTLSIKNSILTFWPIAGYPFPLIFNGKFTTIIFKDNALPFSYKFSSRFLMSGEGHVICNGNNYNYGSFLASDNLNVFGWGNIKSTTDLIVLGENPPIADKPTIDTSKHYTNDASLKFTVTKSGNIAAMNIPKFRTVLETGKCFGISAMINKENYTGDVYLKAIMKTSALETVLVSEKKITGSQFGWNHVTLPINPILPAVEYIDLIVQSDAMNIGQYFHVDDIQVNII